MKRIFSLIFVAVLLSGCPDAKLPNPTPMVPAPKAADSAVPSPSGIQLNSRIAKQKNGSLYA